MRIVQRFSALLGWLAILATGLLLIAEASDIAGGRWRQIVGDVTEWIDRSDLARWTAALLGVLIGLIALAVLVAQFTPAQLTGRSTVVDRGTSGSTRVTAAAIRRAVSQRLRDLPGVVAASPIGHRRRLDMRVDIDQGASVDSVTSAARAQLDEEFWGSLGTEGIRVDLHLTYVPGAARTDQETA